MTVTRLMFPSLHKEATCFLEHNLVKCSNAISEIFFLFVIACYNLDWTLLDTLDD